jgi:phosphate transport system substrate-binding protein
MTFIIHNFKRKMGLKRYLSMLFCILVVFSCGPRKSEKQTEGSTDVAKKSLSGNFAISGAYALYPLVSKWASDFMTLNPGVNIVVSEAGTGQGISDLISGKVNLAMISRPLSDKELESGIWAVPVAKDGVAPIVNQKNPYLKNILGHGLSPDKLQKVFTGGNQMMWGDLLDTVGKDKISVYSRADESGAADVFAGFLFRKASDMKGVKVTGDDEMIKSIRENPLAIGFCNVSFAFDMPSGERKDGIQIIPFDLNFDRKVERKETPFRNLESTHRSIWLGIYPESLCRELTIGSIGKPTDPVVVEFIKYMLAEGQKEVPVTGLCQLNNVYLRYSLDALK